MSMTGLKWVDDLLHSGKSARTRLKNKILEGIKGYNAKWKQNKSGPSTFVGYDKKAVEFHKYLKSNNVEFIGFNPAILYIKENGETEDLQNLWNHQHGTPVLLYKIKNLPGLILAGPTIEHDKSLLAKIAENKNIVVSLKGITS